MALERKPPFIIFWAAYPSMTVYCPDPKTATPSGPLSLRAFLIAFSISSKARCQLTGRNLPFLSNSPLSFIRSRGTLRRSAPYIILALKYPLIQFRPRLTGAAGSPLTATILPSLVASMIPHPVPQKRQGALSQRQPASPCAAAARASSGTAMPTALAAATAAELFKKSRRFIPIITSCMYGMHQF